MVVKCGDFSLSGGENCNARLSAYFKTGLVLIFALSFAYRPAESRDATRVLEKLSVSFNESLHQTFDNGVRQTAFRESATNNNNPVLWCALNFPHKFKIIISLALNLAINLTARSGNI